MITDIIKWYKFCKIIGGKPSMEFSAFRRLLKLLKKQKLKRKTCKHIDYNFKQHGRCCFDCGEFLFDFGD